MSDRAAKLVPYGLAEISRRPRWGFIASHALGFLGATLLLASGGGDPARRLLLGVFGLILWLRMTYTVVGLLERRFGWGEAMTVSVGAAVYQLGFAVLGRGTLARLGWVDAIAIVLFVGGSAMNTLSELGRKRFKSRPENRGRLYTSGLFALSRHPNYLGDVLWGAGWALASENGWAWLIVVIEAAGFVFFNIPALDRYLKSRYGEQYEDWARHTKRFIPFVY